MPKKVDEPRPPDELEINPDPSTTPGRMSGIPEKDLAGERIATRKERLRWDVYVTPSISVAIVDG